MSDEKIAVLFVCTGNICRSPTAEGVFRAQAEKAGWSDLFKIDSAGSAANFVGEPPDRRAQKYAKARGYDLSKLRARLITNLDFEKFDLVLVMDRRNMKEMEKMRSFCRKPKAKLQFLLDYYPGKEGQEVPDPYGGNDKDFETVLDLVETSATNLLKKLLDEKGLTNCGC